MYAYLLKKKGESGVFWAGLARPEHPMPRFIEKIQVGDLHNSSTNTLDDRSLELFDHGLCGLARKLFST